MERSPLLNLPAELRNTIYELALTQPKPLEIRFYIFGSHQGTDGRVFDPKQRKKELVPLYALTQTCKQIRHETGRLFFQLNAVKFNAEIVSTAYTMRAPCDIKPTAALAKLVGGRPAHKFSKVAVELSTVTADELRKCLDAGVLKELSKDLIMSARNGVVKREAKIVLHLWLSVPIRVVDLDIEFGEPVQSIRAARERFEQEVKEGWGADCFREQRASALAVLEEWEVVAKGLQKA